MARGSSPNPAPSSPISLPAPARRLLEVLAGPCVVAVSDPSRVDFVLLRGSRGGVSLGRGSHPRSSLDALLCRDLAQSLGGDAFGISSAGRAFLARAASRRDGRSAHAFAAQHRELVRETVVTPLAADDVEVNAKESPLAWLRRRRGSDGEPLIDAAAYEAGERLRRDLTFAGMLPSVTARWDGAVGGSAGAPRDPAGATDTVIAARQRVRAALAAIGCDFADLLIDLCGFLKGVETIERERCWPQRSGKVVIRLALAQLARHYGLGAEARGRSGGGGIRTWIAEEAPA